jgi:hypothetical protein
MNEAESASPNSMMQVVGHNERDAYADAMQTGQEWLDDDVTDFNLCPITE